MASGVLGKQALPANVAVVYTVPANKIATFTIAICNRTSTQIPVQVYLGTTSDANDVIEYDAPIPKNGVLERTGLVASAGEKVTCVAPLAGLTVRVMGFEEDIT